MKSIIRTLRGGGGGKKKRRKAAKAPTTATATTTSNSEGLLSIQCSKTESSHGSEGVVRKQPQQHSFHNNNNDDDDDEDHTHPLPEQPPTRNNNNNTHSISHDGKIKQHPKGKHHHHPLFSFHRKSSSSSSSDPPPGERDLPKVGNHGGPHKPPAAAAAVVTRKLRIQHQHHRHRHHKSHKGKNYGFMGGFGAMGGLLLPSSLSKEEIHSSVQSVQSVQTQTERIARAVAALDHRGNELFERGYFDKAMEAYSKALKLKRRTFHNMLEEADDLFDDDNKNVEKEDDDDDYALEDSKTDPKLLVSMATSINNIGYLRQRAGDATPDETMAAYKKSLRIKRKILGNNSLSVGKTLNNIGSVYYLKKDYPAALLAYEEGLQVMRNNLGQGHPDVATVISNMGDVDLAQDAKDKALKHYRNALKIRWAAFGEHDPRVVRLLEKIAKIEIGDKMSPKGSEEAAPSFDWDDRQLFDLDFIPLQDELHTLHHEVEEDMQYVDLLEKKMAVDMMKDKILILKGMRELMGSQDSRTAQGTRMDSVKEQGGGIDGSRTEEIDRSERSKSHQDEQETRREDSPKPTSKAARDQAQKHIKERLARLRSQRSAGGDLGKEGSKRISKVRHHSLSNCGHDSISENAAPGIFAPPFYARNQRPALSSLQPDEIKGEVDIIRSALKLRKGIDTLRSFAMDKEEEVLRSAR